MKRRAMIIFFSILAFTVAAPIVFVQTRYFAQVVTKFVQGNMLKDFGIEGSFSELGIKVFPPGVVIKNPSVKLLEKNIADLPAGTEVNARKIEATFELFQLLTGEVNIKGVVLNGAKLKLAIDSEFLKKREQIKLKEKEQKSFFRKREKGLSWDKIFKFNFKSVGLEDSNLEMTLEAEKGKKPLFLSTFARELTIGKATVDDIIPAYDIGLDLGETFFNGFNVEQKLTQLQASITFSSKGVELRTFAIQDSTRNLHVDGKIEGDIFNAKTLKSEFNYLVRGPIEDWLKDARTAKLIGLSKDFEATGMLKFEGKGSADILNFEKTFQTKILTEIEKLHMFDWSLDKLQFGLSLKENDVALDELKLVLPNGQIKIDRVALDTRSIIERKTLPPSGKISMNIDLENVDLHEAAGPALKSIFMLNAKISGQNHVDLNWFQNKGKTSYIVNASNDLVIGKFSFDNQKLNQKKPLKLLLSVPEVKLKTNLAIDENGLSIASGQVKLPGTALDVKGVINSKDGVNLDIKGKVNLQDVGKLAETDIRGSGDLHWTVVGRSPSILFTFDTALKDAEYLNLKLGDVAGRVVYDDDKSFLYIHNLKTQQGRFDATANGSVDLGDSENISIDVNVAKGTIPDLAQVFAHFIEKSVPWYPHNLTGQVKGKIKVSGKTDVNEISVIGDMDIENAEWELETFKSAHMKAGFVKGDLVGRDISILKKFGRIQGNIVYQKNDELKYNLKTENLLTADFDRLAYWDLPYRAPIQFESEGSGKIGTMKSRTTLKVGTGLVRNYQIPSSEVYATTENARLKMSANIFANKAKMNLDLGWNNGSQSSFEGRADGLDFTPILAVINPDVIMNKGVSSEVTGAVKFDFKTGEFSRLSGHATLEKYRLSRVGSSLYVEKPASVQIVNGTYSFEPVHVRGDGTDLTVSGSARNGNVDYSFSGYGNLKLVELFVPEIESSHGEAHLNARLFGPAVAPSVRGEIKVDDSDLRLRSLEQPFESLRYKITLKDSVASLTDINARFSGGRVTGYGKVELFATKAPSIDVLLSLDNPKIQVFPVAYARSNGKIRIVGDELPYKLKGNIVIAEALIKQNFDVGQNGKPLRSSIYLPQGGAGGGEIQLFEMDIDVKAERNFFIKNDLFDADLRCDLKIIKTLKSPKVLGTVGVNSGRILFKDNYFNIESGNLRFTNPSVIDPEFDMTGNTEIKGYKIALVANGKVSDYKLNFQSQPPLSQNDIVSLLTLGNTSSGYQDISSANREAYSRDEMVGLIFNQSSVNKGLKEKLGLNLKLDQSSNNAPTSVFRSQAASDAGATVSPKVVLQKQLTKNLNASAATTVGVGDNRQQDLKLEYDISRKISVMGIYEDQRGALPQNSRTSVGADLKFKLRFK